MLLWVDVQGYTASARSFLVQSTVPRSYWDHLWRKLRYSNVYVVLSLPCKNDGSLVACSLWKLTMISSDGIHPQTAVFDAMPRPSWRVTAQRSFDATFEVPQ